jgi:cytochrome P450
MYETLRLYTPTGVTSKWTVNDQPIVFKNKTYLISKSTRSTISGTAVHFNPHVWGPCPNQFDPYRWLRKDDAGSEPPASPSSHGSTCDTHYHSSSLSTPPSTSSRSINQGLTVFKPPRGTFLPFSEEARGCPAKKFATVDFVAVLVTLLRDHRVTFEEGWSADAVAKVLRGRKAGALTLQPPEVIPLRFVRRSTVL